MTEGKTPHSVMCHVPIHIVEPCRHFVLFLASDMQISLLTNAPQQSSGALPWKIYGDQLAESARWVVYNDSLSYGWLHISQNKGCFGH